LILLIKNGKSKSSTLVKPWYFKIKVYEIQIGRSKKSMHEVWQICQRDNGAWAVLEDRPGVKISLGKRHLDTMNFRFLRSITFKSWWGIMGMIHVKCLIYSWFAYGSYFYTSVGL
jgi:hypothetical protein